MKILFLVFIFIFGCGRDNFKKYYKLKGLRVLAIVADTPMINGTHFTPDATINLTPWLSHPSGNGANINITGVVCLDPGIGLGAKPTCDGSKLVLDEIDLSYDSSLLGSTNYYSGAMTTIIPITIPASAKVTIDNLASSNDLKNGINFIVTLKFQSGSQSISTFKRITYTSRNSVNTNPSFNNIIKTSGSILSSLPNSDTKLKLSNLSTPEDFIFINSDGDSLEVNEDYTISWFVYRGDVFPSRTDSKSPVLYNPPSSGNDLIIAVLRDNRGGVIAKKINL